MATQAHCAYCFETLTSSLERRPPLNLAQVEALWRKYQDGAEDTDEEDDADDIAMDEGVSNSSNRPAAISRLLASSPASASSSSVPSTSSSSSAQSTVSSATSKSSSRSSFFSLGRRSKPAPSRIEESPLFVTWNTIRNSSTRLRGCIGTFEAHELDDGLRSYALTSAFGDTRFDKIKRSELPSLECGVTLLTNFEEVSDPFDWKIGIHGLRITFKHGGQTYGSTYLPDVALEQRWAKKDTLISLMRKAGWTGADDQWRDVKDLRIVRYQGRQVKLRYPEWKQWRQWVEAGGGA